MGYFYMDKRKINLAKFRFEKAEEELEISKTLFDKEYFGASLSSSYYAIFHAVRTVFAFEYRLDSDYVDFYIVEKATAEKQIDSAENFLKEISNFVKSFYKIEL